MKKEADAYSSQQLLLKFKDELIQDHRQLSSINHMTKYFGMFSICSEEEKQLHSEHRKDDRSQMNTDSLPPIPKWRDSIKAKSIIMHRDPKVMMLKRTKYERLGKDQKLFIVNQLRKHNQSISKVAKELFIRYNTVRKLQLEYNSYKKANKESFDDWVNWKRFNKAERKFIEKLLADRSRTFTVIDIKRMLDVEFNRNYSEWLIRSYLKTELKMSFRKSTAKPMNADITKLRKIRAMFWYIVSKRINENVLIVNIDESSFSNDLSNDKGWFKRGQSAEVFNKQYRGSWSLILAITSERDHFGVMASERIDSKRYIKFLEKLEVLLSSRSLLHKIIFLYFKIIDKFTDQNFQWDLWKRVN